MKSQILISIALILFCSVSCSGQSQSSDDQIKLVEAFVNLKDVPEPFAARLAELKADYDQGKIKELRELTGRLDKYFFHENTPDPSAIPYLIALIEADNSYDTVYGVGYFSLARMCDVPYSTFHDGAFWRRWWEKHKTDFPDTFQKIKIPELPKTSHGKSYQPYPESLETLDGLLEYLGNKFIPKNQSAPLTFNDSELSDISRSIAQFNDPKAIPYLIGAIEADNSSATVYGIGNNALRDLTGVKYNVFHDGAFWRRWWEKNKTNYPKEVQSIAIPKYPQTRFGQMYKPFPENTETLAGQLIVLQNTVRYVNTLPEDKKNLAASSFWNVAQSISEFNDPTAIPFLISCIESDNTYGTVYGIGYFGLGLGHSPLTDVKYDESHNGDWWRKWWEENRKNYPEGVQNIAIPSIDDQWNIPDLSNEIAVWRQNIEETDKRNREEEMFKQLARSDVADVPFEQLHVEGTEKMRYFLIGVDKRKPAPESGYKLVVVMPGGDGSAEFHPFVRRIWKYALDESDFIIAQPIAVRWTPNQQIVWPTEMSKVEKQEFSTEQFVESVVADVSKRVKIDPKYVFTMSWSSSGPAAYAIALQEKTAITGSYIVMSVFKPNQLPPLENAEGRKFAIQHSPDDRVCPFRMAKDAEKQLTEHGASVKFTECTGGHGWSGNVYGRVRNNLDWLSEKNENPQD